MTDQQENDALSESAAKVLGWVRGQIGWYRLDESGRPPVSFGNYTILPRFASDWSLLPEMLAWLRERLPDADVVLSQDNSLKECQAVVWPKAAGSMTARGDLVGGVVVKGGDTFPEAVARLVIAVAKRLLGSNTQTIRL